MKSLQKLAIVIFFISSIYINDFTIITINSETTPSKIADFKISQSYPELDTPTFIFEVNTAGKLLVFYNWPGQIGATCSAVLINFWSYEILTEEEQNNFGNLGYLRILRCQEEQGNYTIEINASATEEYSYPLRLYFEIDNDQSLTSAIQDTLYLTIEFYSYEVQNNDTLIASNGLQTLLFISAFVFIIIFNSLQRRKKRK